MTDDDRRAADRLRAYESRSPVPDQGRPAVRFRRMPLAAVAAAAGALAVAVIVATGVLRSEPTTGEASPSPTTSPSSEAPTPDASPEATSTATAAPSATPGPTAEPTTGPTPIPTGPADLDWAVTAELEGDVHISRPVALSGVWLVVGSSGGRAATWSSTDARAWQPAPTIDPPPFNDLMGGGGAAAWSIGGIVEYAGRLIGLGYEHVGCCDGSQIAIWHSADGRSWANEPTRGSSIDTYEIPADAAVAPDGTLVVAATGGLGSSTTIWTTPDGMLWERHPFTEEGAFARIDGLATSGSQMIAVGTGPGVWTSVDGRSWTARERPPGAVEWLSDVAFDAAANRFVVVGSRGDGRAGVWFTSDGISWTGAVLSDGPAETRSVAVGGSVIALGGWHGAVGNNVATVWSSHDGVTWRYVHLGSSESAIAGIDVGADGTTVAAISRWTSGGLTGYQIWTGRLPSGR